MLSDTPSKQDRKTGRNRSIEAGTNKQWSDNQKMEAIQSYLLLGNLALTSRILGIPEITLRVWKRTDWWADMVNEIKSQDRIQLSSRMKKIVDASLTVVEDRLLNGDYQFDQKTGQNIRKPVNMKDAHKVAVDLQDRQDLIEKSQKPEITDEKIESRLLQLAETFATMAASSIKKKSNLELLKDVSDAEIVQEMSSDEGPESF